MLEVTTYPAEVLGDFSTRLLVSAGVPPDDAAQAAEVLIAADLRGIDSHGVARLRGYFEAVRTGRINATPELRVVRETLTTATVDGDNGLGLVVGPRANELAMDKAVDAGSGWVAVRNTNHFGIAGYYVLEALERDLIGWAMTNSSALVAPVFGTGRMLGTNPLAIAFPGDEEPPIVVDLATSAVAFGKIEIARRLSQPIPEGWAIDASGGPATDPQAVFDGGALLPLGSTRELGGHKGYALAMMVDVLSAALSGANWGPFAPAFAITQTPPGSVGAGIGHFFGALRIDGFIEPDEFKRQVDHLARTFRASPPAPGTNGPLVPGDPERAAEAERRRAGIPLIPAVAADLEALATETGVPLG
ncbi:MAG TPA: Ldh family oxidoreductase [Terriglobales bacterium]|nr:Ldh family oxidoreductase [Terriglobales bacterium]